MIEDHYKNQSHNVESQGRGMINIVPSDTEDLLVIIKGLYVGSDGDVAVVSADGSEAVLKRMNAGTILPHQIKRINATGTTATDLVGITGGNYPAGNTTPTNPPPTTSSEV